MIIGTAGHVDHGKTALVKALTGIDTDRLPEEKKRGITLELGFAHFTVPGVGAVSVVDMPGHERFVKAMAAGAGGLDAVLLIIAADEGVMPQTREHLDICALLGVRVGIVVITKADLLPALGEPWRELLISDVQALCKGTFLEKATLLEVSAKSGLGLPALTTEIGALARTRRPIEGPFFLPIDRAFTVKGFGCVVTGTVQSGQLLADEAVALLPSGFDAFRLRGLQVHGVPVERVEAGQRAALNLVGLETSQVHRGMAITRAGELSETSSLEVELSVLGVSEHPLPARSRQLVAIGTAQVEAVVRLLEIDALQPGRSGFAHLRFAKPIAALPGQRFIVRGTRALSGRGATLGGGRVLALGSRRRRRGEASTLSTLAEGDVVTRVTWLLTESGHKGLTEHELFSRASASGKELQGALELAASRGRVLLIDKEHRRWLSAEVFAALKQRALSRLEAFHREHPALEGMPREELRQKLGLHLEKTFARVLSNLGESKHLETQADLVRLPGRSRSVDASTAQLKARLVELFGASGLAPPPLELIAARLNVDVPRLMEVLRTLVAEAQLVKAGELYFDAKAVAALETRVEKFFDGAPTMSTAQLKELVGQSRKFTIPLAEYLDAKGRTLRVGDLRRRRPQ